MWDHVPQQSLSGKGPLETLCGKQGLIQGPVKLNLEDSQWRRFPLKGFKDLMNFIFTRIPIVKGGYFPGRLSLGLCMCTVTRTYAIAFGSTLLKGCWTMGALQKKVTQNDLRSGEVISLQETLFFFFFWPYESREGPQLSVVSLLKQEKVLVLSQLSRTAVKIMRKSKGYSWRVRQIQIRSNAQHFSQ